MEFIVNHRRPRQSKTIQLVVLRGLMVALGYEKGGLSYAGPKWPSRKTYTDHYGRIP